MKKPERRSIFSSIRANARRKSSVSSSQRTRRSRLEILESRDLLAVSALEYETIRAQYPVFDLPSDMNSVNIVEIAPDALGVQALKDALEIASATKQDDLVVVRTSDNANLVQFEKASDQLVVESDPEIFGKTTIVALGSQPLSIDANRLSQVLTLAVGELQLGSVNLVNGVSSDKGGCVYNRGSLVLVNCSISGGSDLGVGRGANLYTDGSLEAYNSNFDAASGEFGVVATGRSLFSNCSISSNSGSGLYAEAEETISLVNSTISRNAADGAVNRFGSLVLESCEVSRNGSTGLVNEGELSLVSCNVSYNANSGLANRSFFLASPFSPIMTVERCVISNNSGVNGAGAINIGGAASFSNCEFSLNYAQECGGAIYCRFSQGNLNQTTVVNCTIAGNTSGTQGGGLFVDSSFNCAVYNSILAMNLTKDRDANVSGSFTSRNNIINASPSFIAPPIIDATTGNVVDGEINLRLTRNSAAINIGDSARVQDSDKDLDGNARIYGKSVDAGAYEYSGSSSTGIVPQCVVTTLEDSFDLNDGETSLREAIYFADDNATVITFSDDLSGEIKLNSQLIVASPMTINGANKITINADNRDRAFLVEAPSTLKGLTLKNARSVSNGGVVYADAPLVLENVLITSGAVDANGLGSLVFADDSFSAVDSVFEKSNFSAALYLNGTASLVNCSVRNVDDDAIVSTNSLELDNCSVYQNGGRGIVNSYGALVVLNSNIYANGDAGVLNVGAATIAYSNIYENSNSGIINQSEIMSNSSLFISTLDVTNSTVSRNASVNGAAIYNRFGRVELVGCELAANKALTSGGAIYNEVDPRGANSITLRNCTAAGNYAGQNGGGIANSDDGALLLMYNALVAMNAAGDFDSNVSGEIVVSESSQVGGNPGFVVAPLFDLQNNAIVNAEELDLRLTANSPLLDKGDNSYVDSSYLVDLEGSARIYNGAVDLGAREYRGTGELSVEPSYLVTTLDDSFDLNDGETSLREALYWARQENAIVSFARNLKGEIKLRSQLVSTANITVDGDSRITVSGDGDSRVLLNESETTLKNLALVDGKTSSLGAVVYSTNVLQLENVAIRRGAIDSQSGELVRNNGNIVANAPLTLRNSIVSDAVDGSGVCAFDSFTAVGTTIENNAALGAYLANSASLTDSFIKNNGLSGIYNNYGSIELKNVELANNSGSGLENLGSASLTGCLVVGNSESGLANLSETHTDSARYSGLLKVYNSIIKNNASSDVGGGVRNLGGSVEINNSEISANVATTYGGGIYNEFSTGRSNRTVVVNCTIAGNSAKVQGGGIYTNSSYFVFNLYNSIVAKNYSSLANANVEGPITDSSRNIASGNPSFLVDPVFSDLGTLLNVDEYDLRLRENSVAVDYGLNEYVVGTLDLQGAVRIFNNVVDVGAYEYFVLGSTRVDSLDDSFNLNDGVTSLREALYFAQNGSVVTFDPDLRGVVYLDSELTINANVAVLGNGVVTLDANGRNRILVNNADVTISGITFRNGFSEDAGGAILNSGRLDLEDCVFYGNKATNGGAIYNEKKAILNVADSEFVNNEASENAGALYNNGSVFFSAVEFRNNSAGSSGGPI